MKSSAVKHSGFIAGITQASISRTSSGMACERSLRGATRACRNSSPPSTRIGMAAISQQLFVSSSFAIASIGGIARARPFEIFDRATAGDLAAASLSRTR